MRTILTSLLVTSTASAFQYYNDPRIHNLGNTGAGGLLHAMLAPVSTRIIDSVAYKGEDLRSQILRDHVVDDEKKGARDRVVDLCCGVGFSTQSLGVDTSPQMLAVAEWIHACGDTEKRFERGNAETWGETDAFDKATCMFAFHEMPQVARRRVLWNMLRISREALLVDISPEEYEPSEMMLLGEPYILEYQRNVDADVEAVAAAQGATVHREAVVPGHAVLWRVSRDA